MRNQSHCRTLMLVTTMLASASSFAQSGGFLAQLENPSVETNYILLGMAVVQAIIIVTLSGIMKTLGGSGKVWVEYLKGRRAGVLLLPLLLGMGGEAQALSSVAVQQATASTQSIFWYLFAANVIFFIIIVAQLTVLKGMVRILSGKPEEETAMVRTGEAPSFADTILQKLTKRPVPEKEKDLLMHHEYDGIRELDNVLPPWWVWLFYATIIWSVVFLVGKHVINVIPHQNEEYTMEMEASQVEIDAYLALQAAAVDENTVVALADAASLGAGKRIFTEFCKACHGELGEGNAVGPNLTDPYWIHGGSINDLFRTIKYGVVEKGMQSWKNDLNPQDIQAVSSYIMSLQGSDPPNAKAPEGELYTPVEVEPGAPAPDEPPVVGDQTVARSG